MVWFHWDGTYAATRFVFVLSLVRHDSQPVRTKISMTRDDSGQAHFTIGMSYRLRGLERLEQVAQVTSNVVPSVEQQSIPLNELGVSFVSRWKVQT